MPTVVPRLNDSVIRSGSKTELFVQAGRIHGVGIDPRRCVYAHGRDSCLTIPRLRIGLEANWTCNHSIVHRRANRDASRSARCPLDQDRILDRESVPTVVVSHDDRVVIPVGGKRNVRVESTPRRRVGPHPGWPDLGQCLSENAARSHLRRWLGARLDREVQPEPRRPRRAQPFGSVPMGPSLRQFCAW